MFQIFPFAGFTQLFYKTCSCYRLHPQPSLRLTISAQPCWFHLTHTCMQSLHKWKRKASLACDITNTDCWAQKTLQDSQTHFHVLQTECKTECKTGVCVCVFYSIPKNLIDKACDTLSVWFSFNFSLRLLSCEYDHTSTVTSSPVCSLDGKLNWPQKHSCPTLTWPKVVSIFPRRSSSFSWGVVLSMSYTAIINFCTSSKK